MRWRDRIFAKGKLLDSLGMTVSFLALVVLLALIVALVFLIFGHGW